MNGIVLAVIMWRPEYYAAMEESRVTGKPVLILFKTTPCVWCDKLEAALPAAVNDNYIPVRVQAGELSRRMGVSRFPYMIIGRVDGTILKRAEGYNDILKEIK